MVEAEAQAAKMREDARVAREMAKTLEEAALEQHEMSDALHA